MTAFSAPPRNFWERMTWLLSTDFCPNANQYVYWLKNPFWLLVLTLLASILCGVFVNGAILLVSGVLLLVIGLGLLYPRLALWGVDCEIRFERSRCRCGQVTGVELTISNRWPFPVWGLALHRGFTDRLAETLTAEQGLALARVPGWSQTTWRWQFRPDSRGVYPLETPRMETAFPFGLWTADKAVTATSTLIVWPETVPLQGTPESLTLCPQEDRLSDRQAGEFGDMLGTRGFRPGDSLRRVHWAQTARHGRLVVCERQAPALAGIRLSADLSSEAHDCSQAGSSLEWAIQIVGSICESLQHQHGQVECVLGQDVIQVGRSAADLRKLMDTLARIPKTGLESAPKHGRGAGSLPEFSVITSRSRLAGQTSGQTILIDLAGELPPPCSRRAASWIRLQPHEGPVSVLPLRWKKACYGT